MKVFVASLGAAQRRAVRRGAGAARARRQSRRWLIHCCNEPSRELNWKQMCRTDTAVENKLNHSRESGSDHEIKKASEINFLNVD